MGRFYTDGVEFTGALDEDTGRVRKIESPFERVPIGREFDLHELRYLPPIIPSKIVCVGLNYADHARELGLQPPDEPLIFLKPPSAITAHGGDIVYPRASKRVEYEGELAVVVGKKYVDVTKSNAHEMILGYTALNDVTARDLQERDGQWTRSKSFDTFAPMGPWIATVDEVEDCGSLAIRTFLNDEKRQDSNTKNFIFDVPELMEFISGVMTLLPGDVITTGTPPGVGVMRPGDVVKVEIEGIGILVNHVVVRDE
ncbi:MAG: fumarylacetoacetate hydrolase family protein [Candidatus Hydrothermarchaeaceae archaeon]